MVDEEQPVLGDPPALPDGLWASVLEHAFTAPVPDDLDALLPSDEAFGETLDDAGWADAGAFATGDDGSASDGEDAFGPFGSSDAPGHVGDWSEASHGSFSDHHDDAGSPDADF
ncbi:MAG: hypothetical protein J7480_08935 [Microbacteriaceae bacterium]|nr:hypothetical protein [Microbacteriaceae bacterium]